MNLETVKSFRDEVEKIAARRGLKEISKLLAAGKGQAASALAKTPGVLKPSAAGSQIRQLGAGSEGLASLVAHPEHGVSVRKLYDPAGMSSPAMIARKEQAGKAMGANPHVAQFHGSAQAPGGSTMHFNEYVPGKAMGSGTSARWKSTPGVKGMGTAEHEAARAAVAGTHKALRGAGFSGGGRDLRMGNMVMTPEGKAKVIDYMPVQKGEFAGSRESARLSGGNPSMMVAKTPAAAGLFQGGGGASQGTPTPALLRSQLGAGRPMRPPKFGPMPNLPAKPGPPVPGSGSSATMLKQTDRTPPVQMKPL